MSRWSCHHVVPDADGFERFAALDASAPTGQLPTATLTAVAHSFEPEGAARWLVLVDHGGSDGTGDGTPVGRALVTVNPRARTADDAPVGYIGALVFPDDGEALAALLGPALDWLRSHGCGVVRAPVTFHTWLPFRFVTEGTARPPVPGELSNPPYYPTRFEEQGFAAAVRYVSSETDELDEMVAANQTETAALAGSELTLRAFDPTDPERQLRRLYAVVAASFPVNFSFSPLHFEEFRAFYGPQIARVDPRLFPVCEDADRPDPELDGLAGFMLSYPDPGDPTGKTVVLKTLAVHPRYRGRGVGPALIADAHARARAAGYERAVHAMMREGRRPHTVSARAVPVFRRYSILEKTL